MGAGRQTVALLATAAALWAAGSGAQGAAAAELSAPAAASWSTTRFDVIARGEDGLIYQKYYDNGTWSGWGSIGAPSVGAASSPTVTTPGPNVLQVFVRGGDGYIWNNHWTYGQGSAPGGWSGWGQVPHTGNATWAPSATNGPDATPDVFYTGTDGAVWYSRYDDVNGWNWPVSLGGGVLGSPGATTTVGGRMQVAVRGTDSRIYLRFADSPTGWTGWGQIPGALTSMSPAVTTGNDGQFNMFYRGYDTDAAMYHEYYSATAGWVGPGGIPGSNLVSSPAAARLNIYQRNSAGDIQQWYYDPSWGWRGPGSIGQPSSDGRLFREQNSNAVYYMDDGTRYWVSSPQTAQELGLDLGSTVILPIGSLASIPRGHDLVPLDQFYEIDKELIVGDVTPVTATEADPDQSGGAAAAGSSGCRWITQPRDIRVGVSKELSTKIGWVSFRSRFCWNRVAHTTWANDRYFELNGDIETAWEVAGYKLDLRDEKVSYNVSHRDSSGSAWPRGGIHTHMRYQVGHCTPGTSIVLGCTHKPIRKLINYGYFDSSGLRVVE